MALILHAVEVTTFVYNAMVTRCIAFQRIGQVLVHRLGHTMTRALY